LDKDLYDDFGKINKTVVELAVFVYPLF